MEMKFKIVENPIDYIRGKLSQEELLAQLAEECAELVQAALKLRRVYSGSNPTPVNREDAFNNLIEEIADVTLCAEVLGLNTPELCFEVGRIWNKKLKRWADRLKEAEEGFFEPGHSEQRK